MDQQIQDVSTGCPDGILHVTCPLYRGGCNYHVPHLHPVKDERPNRTAKRLAWCHGYPEHPSVSPTPTDLALARSAGLC